MQIQLKYYFLKFLQKLIHLFEIIMKELNIQKIDTNNHFILLSDELVGKTQIINQFIETNFKINI